MGYLKPSEVVIEAVETADKKAGLPVRDLVLRSALSGALLGVATSFVMVILAQGLPPIVGAIAFPVGFVILVLLGLDLATGNFALMPMGVAAKRVTPAGLARNWGWVYLGNFLGSVLYAVLFYLAITNFGATDGGAVAGHVRQIAHKKTLAYAALGAAGWGTALVKGILCNWMVSLGTLMAMTSRSAMGKIVAMWLPITVFFAHGYEHSVVNMYLIPSAMLLGEPITVSGWLLWNQIPVTIGNVLGGAVFTGLALYATHARRGTDGAVIVALPAESSAPSRQRTAVPATGATAASST